MCSLDTMTDRKSLDELQSENTARATAESLGIRFTIRADCDDVSAAEAEREKAITELDEYFAAFCASPDCPRCGLALRGKGIMHAFLGGFEWGLVNGEGHCSRCQYPCRAYHRNVGALEFFECVLAYHPSSLTPPATEAPP